MNAAIATHLNVTPDAILEIQVWAKVLWVRVRGLGARFVSKKVAPMNAEMTKEQLIGKMESIGGSRWTKGNHDRMYFHGSLIARLLKLSNSKARQINAAKFYYDLNSGEFQACSTKCWGVTDTPGVGKNRKPYWVEAIIKAVGM